MKTIVKAKKGNSKGKCEKCKKIVRIRTLVKIKGKNLCFNCRQKMKSSRIQKSAESIGRGKISLKKALKKTYVPKLYIGKNGSHCTLSLPISMAEKKINISLVKDDK